MKPGPSGAQLSRGIASRDGSALLMVIMLLAAIGVLLGSLFTATHADLSAVHAQWRKDLARTLAEAGIQAAAAQLAEHGHAHTGETGVVLGQGTYSTVVKPGKSPGEYGVTSTGYLRDGDLLLHRATLSAKVRIVNGRIAVIEFVSSAPGEDAVP